MTVTALRRLPMSAPPAYCETLDSYFDRLANINYLSTGELKAALGFPAVGKLASRITADQLSVLTGMTTDGLIRTLVELRGEVLQHSVFAKIPGPACPRCTHRHPGGQVYRFYPHHSPACPKHRLWIGGGPAHVEQPSDRFVDISRTPAVLSAQRHHRRLVRRYGAKAVSDGFTLASNFLSDEEWPSPSGETAEIMSVLRPGAQPVFITDPVYKAARYPRVIRLAVLFITPHWQAVAASSTAWPAFFAEVGTRAFGISDFQPNGNNAINRWVERQAIQSHSQQHQGT